MNQGFSNRRFDGFNSLLSFRLSAIDPELSFAKTPQPLNIMEMTSKSL